jgi:hypothetical protein
MISGQASKNQVMKKFESQASASSFIKAIFAMAAVLGTLCSCTKNMSTTSKEACSGAPKSFAADVNPIIQASCAFDSDCHGSGSANGPGSLLNYAQIFDARLAIRSAVESGNMPKDATLTASQKNAIICWIDNGAANN